MTRSEAIHEKGFDLFGTQYTLQDVDGPLDYRKIKVGVKNLDDAVLNLGSLNANLPKYNGVSKGMIFQALATNDYPELRRISNLFYNVSGMYQRVCDYFAYLYRYDWCVAAEVYDESVKTWDAVLPFGNGETYVLEITPIDAWHNVGATLLRYEFTCKE